MHPFFYIKTCKNNFCYFVMRDLWGGGGKSEHAAQSRLRSISLTLNFLTHGHVWRIVIQRAKWQSVSSFVTQSRRRYVSLML